MLLETERSDGVILGFRRRVRLTRTPELLGGPARVLIALLCLGGLGPLGCAAPPPPDDPEALESFRQTNDPLEPLNRVVFAVNIEADRYILKPVAYVYKEAVPQPVQDGMGNFLQNLGSPVVFMNSVLQGDVDHAGATLLRFLINSTVGLAGTADVAGEMGFLRRDEDFGQTLGVWGADEGPYIMLPLLGPSSTRDALGLVVDYFADPWTYLRYEKFSYSRRGAEFIDARARNYELLNDLEKTSVDYYAAVRSLYRQDRRDAIRNGAEAGLPALPDIPADEEEFEDDEKEPAGRPAQ